MIFLKESLYGWGVCNIPQPRATQDIYADRRGRAQAVAHEQRLHSASVGFWGVWAGLLKRDFPLGQIFSVVAASLFLIMMFGLASFLLPAMEQQDNPPLEILAMVLEEPEPEPAPVDVVMPPPAQLPVEPVKTVQKPRSLPLPKPVKTPPAVVVVRPESVPVARPRQVVTLPKKATNDTLLPGPRTVARTYRDAVPTPGPMPAGLPDASFAARSANELEISSSSLQGRYSQTSQTASSAMPTRSAPRLSNGSATEVDLPSSGGVSRNLKVSHATQSMRGSGTAKTFVPATGGPAVAIRGASGVAGNVAEAGNPGTAAVAPSDYAARSVGERVGLIGGAEDVDVPVLVGSGTASGALGGTELSNSAPVGDGLASGAIDFNGVEEGHYDPARMISLNQLKACIDPDAELDLKTRLATELDTAGKCSIRNMVFFYKYPENAYTLQVDVYNPENFGDRCDALRTAIQCVNP